MSSRNFILTLNAATLEFYADVIQYLKSLCGLNYLLVTEHLGQENKHYHVYVQYERSKKLSIKKLHGAHIEKCFGSAKANIQYLKAEDEKHKQLGVTAVIIEEEGRPVMKGGDYSVAYLKDISDEEDMPDYRMYNTWKRLKRDTKVVKAKDFRKNVKVYWIQGPSGVGKTNKAIELASEFEETLECGTDFKFVNGFYLGTTSTARVAIYDDFRDSHMKPSEFINLIDYNKHWMNIKGDSILNNYNVVIITIVQKFNKIFRNVDDEPRAQWERRVQVIDMFPPERVSIGGLPIGYRTGFNELENYVVNDPSDSLNVLVENNDRINQLRNEYGLN